MALEREELDAIALQARDLGRAIKAQFDGFVEAGFDPSQAMQLTTAYLRAMVTEANRGDS